MAWFTCEGGPDPLQGQFGMAAVGRQVDADATPIERMAATLQALLAGPTAIEQEAGLTSWFSDQTAGALQSVTIESCDAATDGTERWADSHAECGRDEVLAVVDFADFSDIIPAAAETEEAAQMLLGELNGAVIGFSEVDGWLFRFEGDCDAFWNWLPFAARGGGAGCLIMTRG